MQRPLNPIRSVHRLKKHLETLAGKFVRALARPLGADLAQSIHARQIDIRPNVAAGGDAVTATYSFEHASTMTGGAVVLDISASPLPFLAAHGHRCQVHGPVPLKGARFLVCKLMPGEDWSRASIEVQLAWPKRSTNAFSPEVLIFPDWLPTLINEQLILGPWPQPLLRCSGSEPAAFVRKLDDARNSLRQLVLYREELAGVVAARPQVEIDLGVGLRDLREREQTRIVSLLADIVSYLAADLQYDLCARIVALAVQRSGRYPALYGAPCLSEAASVYGAADGANPNHATLARSLAGLWWAAGCRMYGTNALQLSFAICGALGLRWTAHVDANRAARFAEGYREERDNVQRTASVRLGRSWLLSLYRAMCHEERSVMSTLRRLTAEHFGYYVSADEIRASLVRAGVALD